MRVNLPEAPIDCSLFATDYDKARERFMAAAQAAGATAGCYIHPLTGPNGTTLATDTAWLGPENAKTVLVLLSATHGVEGFHGSAAQIDALNSFILPEGTALLAVHAVNPHGFAWLRRVTEDGIDLNRNFIDFDSPLPENHGYDELADAIIPDALDEDSLAAADKRLKEYADYFGQIAFEAALSGGQFGHADGLFYGGRAPSWSRLTTETIIHDYALAERQRVAVIDFHTGLGPFGYGEPICDHLPGTLGLERARSWYGQSVTEPAIGTSSSVAKEGLSDFGWQRLLGDKLVFIALEFGTYPFDNMIRALRGDHWLHRQGDIDWQSSQTRQIKSAIRRHFYPETFDWQQMVLFRSRQCITQALAGLAEEAD